MSKNLYRATSGGSVLRILESVSDDSLDEGAGKYRVCIIRPGVGSSGIYVTENLAASLPLFTEGTKMYMDHPGYDDRPERSVMDLAGKFLEDATMDDDGSLNTSIMVYPSYNKVIKEKWDDIGISINAWSYESVSPEGIVPPFDGVNSVDFVTTAGAGGALLEVLESQREDPADETKEDTHMEKFEESANALAEAVGTLVALMTTQAEEAAKVKDAKDKEDEDEKKKQKESASISDALEIAKAIEAAKLPEKSVERVTAAIEAGAEYKKAIADEQDYIKVITESVKAGPVEERTDLTEAHRVTGFRTKKGGK